MDPAQGCIKNDVSELILPGQIASGREVVAGYDTVRITSENATYWFALALGCAQVKSRVVLSSGTINEQVATGVAPGEPDDGLFYIPQRYSEVPPSVFHQLEPNSREANTLDRSYFARRPPR
jgi:hypothetical protein